MNDMTAVIIPKSDQINADDLIAGPRTITITDVKIDTSAEQPVSILFEGSEGKVWRPCKTVSRVLVKGWGPDAKKYVGRSVTLYRDDRVTWAGMKVGGIRVSHMSHIGDDGFSFAPQESRGKRVMVTVKPLATPTGGIPGRGPELIAAARQAIADAPDLEALRRVWLSRAMSPFRDTLKPELDARKAELETGFSQPEGRPDADMDEGFTDEGFDGGDHA